MGFFYFILPPIIFAAGYTLKHRRFVNNLDTIMLLGVIGTLISMVVMTLILSFANAYLFFEGSKIMTSEILVLVTIFSLIKIIGLCSLCIRYYRSVKLIA
jgi:hypothetical protein